jgi:dolichyl-phosphate-mannose-protein mannosyltransferase
VNRTGVSDASATRLLLGLAAVRLAIQFAGINHYGFFRDELYYMACGEHLAWGYVDQPPLIALLAWLVRHTMGDSMLALRLLPALAGAATVFLTGVLARELGGGRFAQLLAAAALLFAPAYLAFDSFFSMNAFEPLFWIVCAILATRIVKGASPQLWIAFGVVAGIGLENKHTMLLFGFALIAGLLISGHAKILRSPWIWIGGAVALVIFLPNLVWEASHGWPQIQVVRNAQHFKNVTIGPLGFIWDDVLFLHPVTLPIWGTGLAWLLFAEGAKRYRFLGVTFLIVLGAFILLGGKSYYALPAYPLLLAAGGVALENYLARPGLAWLKVAYPALLVIAGLVTIPFGVPVLPVDTFLRYSQLLPYASEVKTERDATAALPQLYADMFGWDTMAGSVASVYHALSAAEQANCAILAGNYGEAGAIDYYGPKLGLPKALSGHNSYFYWGPRDYSGSCVIVFGERSDEFKALFAESTIVATTSNPHGMPNEQRVPIYLCRKPRAPVAELWPHFKMII